MLLNIKGVKNRDFFCLRDSAHAEFGFSLSDVTVNVLTIHCQIPAMSNLAISLREVTIDAYLTLHVLLFISRLKVSLFSYLDCFYVS